MDNLKLADQHLVAMISSIDPSVKCCEIIESINVETVSAPVMFRMTSLITQTLPNYELCNIANLVDAASPNWKALLADSTHAAKDFLPAELMAKFSKIDYSMKHIQRDPVKNFPIVNSPDPLHLGKNICTALEKSDSKFSKRYIIQGLSNESWNDTALLASNWWEHGSVTGDKADNAAFHKRQ